LYSVSIGILSGSIHLYHAILRRYRMRTTILRLSVVIILGVGFSGLSPVDAVAQSPSTRTPSTLQEQFVFLKEESNTYKDKKIIRETELNQFWTNVRDSLAQVHQQLARTKNNINAQEAEIDTLNARLESQRQMVEESEHASTHISVLGIDILKNSFLSFFWITASVLTLLLLGALYQYRHSKMVTSKTQYNLRAIQRELEDFRKKSLEKERKLRRELQTERNRVEELKLVASQKR
jgi:septal ring factor EnvC (AmiA/AmiB activator)